MTEQELAVLIAYGREQRGIEFKRAGRGDDKAFMAVVMRAALAMANKRDGGRIIIGVEETNSKLIPKGLSEIELGTWSFDFIADRFRAYTDPAVEFDLEAVRLDEQVLVVITIKEFDDIPILCKRDYEKVLRDGACYVRSRRKPESVEIPTHIEMRELLDLAADKNLRRFLARVEAVGLLGLSQPAAPSDQEQYDAELGDLK